MTDMPFSQLNLDPRLEKAVTEMGFDAATPVQAEVIPLIRAGADVIAKSQTGTGKTAAFAIPALEAIDTKEEKTTIQVLILCPTRELAQQAGAEIRKLSKFMTGIRPVEVYGGTDMQRQFIQLRRGNLVVGTPGRVMDHMRRGTMKLDNLKMIVLDEADEMLNMGFKEDIETILRDTPDQRQTVLFSATMPPSIMAITKNFQRDPKLVEINKSQVTLAQIDQSCIEVPMGKKKEALNLLLRLHRPHRALIFCNTKRMVDEVSEYLNQNGFSAESIHGDMKQVQRTRVMNEFKRGRVDILIATDVAARGIDVNDLDYVINYDIPMNTEYYVHRIGRTGRAGKSGNSITLCCGRRQVAVVRGLAREVKSEIRQDALPTPAQIQEQDRVRRLEQVEKAVQAVEEDEEYIKMVQELMEKGYEADRLAAALLRLHFPKEALPTAVSAVSAVSVRAAGKKSFPSETRAYTNVVIDIGASNRVEPKHLVGAITERSGLSAKEVGRIDIRPTHSVVGVPTDRVSDVLESMSGCKICGKSTQTARLSSAPERGHGKPATPYSGGSKGAFFASQRLAQRQTRRSKDPVRRKHIT